MRLLRIAFVVATLALALGACASATPGWTYAPQVVIPSTAAAASPAASPAASQASSPSVSGSPAATPAASGPAASQGAAGAALKVTAQNIAFDPTSLTATANTAFQISFANQDQGIPHNIDIKDGSGTTVFKGDLVTGPNTATYAVPALPAGDYTFVCDVHTGMTGTLSVK
ncbi:MAG: cupredoxin domain-containing protein [Candidatus Limnocylindrales bacterium]